MFRKNRLGIFMCGIFIGPLAYVLADVGAIPDVQFPTLAKSAASAEGFVPKGWVLDQKAEGDLDGDQVPDLALVLRQNDPKNILKNDGLGDSELNTNPRILAIAFQDKVTHAYHLVVEEHKLIPRHEDPVEDDPFSGIVVSSGTLKVKAGSFRSAGSWSTTQSTLTFRYQNNCFQLIGLDHFDYMRSTGDETDTSINYSTGKVKITKSEEENKPVVTWLVLKEQPKRCIADIGDERQFVEIQLQEGGE